MIADHYNAHGSRGGSDGGGEGEVEKEDDTGKEGGDRERSSRPTFPHLDQVMQCDQKAGDVLFIPARWGHATLNMHREATAAFALEIGEHSVWRQARGKGGSRGTEGWGGAEASGRGRRESTEQVRQRSAYGAKGAGCGDGALPLHLRDAL